MIAPKKVIPNSDGFIHWNSLYHTTSMVWALRSRSNEGFITRYDVTTRQDREKKGERKYKIKLPYPR